MPDNLNRREIIPDAWRTTTARTPTGAVVIEQAGDIGPQTIIIPAVWVRAFIEGFYRTAQGDKE